MERSNAVGSRIKRLREGSDIRQNQLATYLNIDQSYLSKVEAGERSISVELLEKLAVLFGQDMSVFYEDAQDIRPVQMALRAREIAQEDLEVLAAINRIALNSRMMSKLLGERT